MVDLVNNKTGEFLEIKKEPVPFRTLTNLKDYKDGEKYTPDSSEVDLTGYEPLESIIARCTRVMRAPGGQSYSVLDKTALQAEATVSGVYEAAGATSIDEAFDRMDPTDEPGFDLADASALLSEVEKDLSTTSQSEQLKLKASDDAASAVDKSEETNDNKQMFDEKKE